MLCLLANIPPSGGGGHKLPRAKKKPHSRAGWRLIKSARCAAVAAPCTATDQPTNQPTTGEHTPASRRDTRFPQDIYGSAPLAALALCAVGVAPTQAHTLHIHAPLRLPPAQDDPRRQHLHDICAHTRMMSTRPLSHCRSHHSGSQVRCLGRAIAGAH